MIAWFETTDVDWLHQPSTFLWFWEGKASLGPFSPCRHITQLEEQQEPQPLSAGRSWLWPAMVHKNNVIKMTATTVSESLTACYFLFYSYVPLANFYLPSICLPFIGIWWRENYNLTLPLLQEKETCAGIISVLCQLTRLWPEQVWHGGFTETSLWHLLYL